MHTAPAAALKDLFPPANPPPACTPAYLGCEAVAAGTLPPPPQPSMSYLAAQEWVPGNPAAQAEDVAYRLPFDAARLRVIVAGLIEETQRVVDHNHDLESKLKTSSSEVKQLREMLASLQQQASKDALTGIGNRGYFERELIATTQEAAKTGEPLCLLARHRLRVGPVGGERVAPLALDSLPIAHKPLQDRPGELAAERVNLDAGQASSVVQARAEALLEHARRRIHDSRVDVAGNG